MLCADRPEAFREEDHASIAALLAAYGDWPAAPVSAATDEKTTIESKATACPRIRLRMGSFGAETSLKF